MPSFWASMTAEIKHAYLEGRPVRLNDTEAWWVINGAWRALHLGEAAFNAKLLSKEEFSRWFGDLPELPSTAFQAGEYIVPSIDEDLAAMSGDELYRRARSLPAGDPRITAYILAARGVYSAARAQLSPEWWVALGDVKR
jgi:hypothetical protein